MLLKSRPEPTGRQCINGWALERIMRKIKMPFTTAVVVGFWIGMAWIYLPGCWQKARVAKPTNSVEFETYTNWNVFVGGSIVDQNSNAWAMVMDKKYETGGAGQGEIYFRYIGTNQPESEFQQWLIRLWMRAQTPPFEPKNPRWITTNMMGRTNVEVLVYDLP